MSLRVRTILRRSSARSRSLCDITTAPTVSRGAGAVGSADHPRSPSPSRANPNVNDNEHRTNGTGGGGGKSSRGSNWPSSSTVWGRAKVGKNGNSSNSMHCCSTNASVDQQQQQQQHQGRGRGVTEPTPPPQATHSSIGLSSSGGKYSSKRAAPLANGHP